MVLEHFLTRERSPGIPVAAVAAGTKPTPDEEDIFGQPLAPAPVPAPPVLLREPSVPDPLARPQQIKARPANDTTVSGLGWTLMDNSQIGGRFSIIISLEGQEYRPQIRTIQSVTASIPEARRDLRVTTFNVTQQIKNLLESLQVPVYEMERPGRGPALARVLADAVPLEKYLVWFSDLAHVKSNDWAPRLVETILRQPPESAVGFYGVKRREVLRSSAIAWFKQASWFRGRSLRNKRGTESPNGNEIHYALSHFWAASVAALRDAKIPDERIETAGMHICMGEQLYQAGWNTKMFDGDSRMIGITVPHNQTRINPPWYSNG